ncbi:hypothetical protein VIGAN_09129400 [Vigna angularis var. angularis]|uniref:Uncharacterized protein n=1 Tax=Vigna angularis var. angularis TaxID=157739 RepID=A0A0S3SYG0_PHAAN|nr:hypothetical protein VIGAN_09129400 [Vigna angularis var. angularis]
MSHPGLAQRNLSTAQRCNLALSAGFPESSSGPALAPRPAPVLCVKNEKKNNSLMISKTPPTPFLHTLTFKTHTSIIKCSINHQIS